MQWLKVAQINYVLRNQLHCTAKLNFGLICKKAKHCWALSTNFSFQFSWYFFLIMFCFMLNWRKTSNYFKIAEWRSDSMKRNFGGFIFKLNLRNLVDQKPFQSWSLSTSPIKYFCYYSTNRCAYIILIKKSFFSLIIMWTLIK